MDPPAFIRARIKSERTFTLYFRIRHQKENNGGNLSCAIQIKDGKDSMVKVSLKFEHSRINFGQTSQRCLKITLTGKRAI
jgi:hypothetical protein